MDKAFGVWQNKSDMSIRSDGSKRKKEVLL